MLLVPIEYKLLLNSYDLSSNDVGQLGRRVDKDNRHANESQDCPKIGSVLEVALEGQLDLLAEEVSPAQLGHDAGSC